MKGDSGAANEKPQSPERRARIENKIVDVDKKKAYTDFKDREGKEYNDSIVEAVESLKEKKEEIKYVTEQCNKIKVEIEQQKNLLDKKQANKNQEEIIQGIIDEEEYHIMQ